MLSPALPHRHTLPMPLAADKHHRGPGQQEDRERDKEKQLSWGHQAAGEGEGNRACWVTRGPTQALPERKSVLKGSVLSLAAAQAQRAAQASAELGWRAGLYNNLSPAGSLRNTRATFVPEKQTHQRLPVRRVNREVTAHQGAGILPGPAGLIISTGTHTYECFRVRHVCRELPMPNHLNSVVRAVLELGEETFPLHTWVTQG